MYLWPNPFPSLPARGCPSPSPEAGAWAGAGSAAGTLSEHWAPGLGSGTRRSHIRTGRPTAGGEGMMYMGVTWGLAAGLGLGDARAMGRARARERARARGSRRRRSIASRAPGTHWRGCLKLRNEPINQGITSHFIPEQYSFTTNRPRVLIS